MAIRRAFAMFEYLCILSNWAIIAYFIFFCVTVGDKHEIFFASILFLFSELCVTAVYVVSEFLRKKLG
jgi:hypothetical protein